MNAPGPATASRPPVTDVLLAIGLAVLGLVEIHLLADAADRLPAVIGVLGLSLPLAWRRRTPLAALLIVSGTEVTIAQLGVPIDSLIVVIPTFVVAVYSLGAHAATRRAGVGLAAAVAAVWISTFADEGPGVDNLAFGLVVVTAPWLAGRLVRRRTDQAMALVVRAGELERSQAERERLAVLRERARIARELHDIISHSVSVMTIQAGAIEEVIDGDRDAARMAARSIRDTGRAALTDLRRLLNVLREDGRDGEALVPQPDIADLQGLVEQVRRAGLEVDLDVDDLPPTLPQFVALSAVRVVQESLTNTLKHADATHARVRLRLIDGAIDIEVVDDGTQPVTSGDELPGGGHGLTGMRERMTLYGGRLEYGRQPSGGFRVHAWLPVGQRLEVEST